MNNQLKLGIFTAALTLTKTYHVYAKFNNIAGLTRKAKVKIAGVGVVGMKYIEIIPG